MNKLLRRAFYSSFAVIATAVFFLYPLVHRPGEGASAAIESAHAKKPSGLLSRDSLKIDSESMTFGLVNAGREVIRKFSGHSPGEFPLIVPRVESSCSCLELSPPPLRIAPRSSSEIHLTLNLSKEPGSLGCLAIAITGYQADGVPLFRTQVKVEVRKAIAPLP